MQGITIAASIVCLLGLGASATAAQSPSLDPADGEQRIERTADGFAIVLPQDWTLAEVPPELSEEQGEVWDEAGSRGFARFIVIASQPGGEGGCLVTDLTAVARAVPPWASVDDAVDVRLAMLETMPDVGTATSTFIDLPAGRTGRIDTTFQGRLNSRFYFSDTEAWFSLSCVSSDPPDDDWISIAESFEFLPPEE